MSATDKIRFNEQVAEEAERWIRPDDCSAALRPIAVTMANGNSSDQRQGSFPSSAASAPPTGMSADHELYLRQRCAIQAQYLGNRMRLKQICINTAIVCMHRMFMVHNIDKFNNLYFIGASLFIASKVEEVPISLEYCAQTVLSFHSNGHPVPNGKSPQCQATMQEIVFCENAIIHTLAFNFDIIHPNYFILSYCNKLNLPKDLTKLAYTLGTYILILSNMCVRYKPSILACICINLAFKFIKEPNNDTEEGQINEDQSDVCMEILDGCKWIKQFEENFDPELLEKLTIEYQNSIQRTPTDLKKDLIRLTFPDTSQINPLITNLLFSNSNLSQSLIEKNQPKIEDSTDNNPAKRALFNEKSTPEQPKLLDPNAKGLQMNYSQYKEFSTNIKKFITVTKTTFLAGASV